MQNGESSIPQKRRIGLYRSVLRRSVFASQTQSIRRELFKVDIIPQPG